MITMNRQRTVGLAGALALAVLAVSGIPMAGAQPAAVERAFPLAPEGFDVRGDGVPRRRDVVDAGGVKDRELRRRLHLAGEIEMRRRRHAVDGDHAQ